MNNYEVVVKKVYVYTQKVMIDAYCVAEAERKAMAMESCGSFDPTWNTLMPRIELSFVAKEV